MNYGPTELNTYYFPIFKTQYSSTEKVRYRHQLRDLSYPDMNLCKVFTLHMIIQHIACSADYLVSQNLTVATTKHEFCQNCLLVRAAAIHLDIIDQSYKRTTYWALGLAKLFPANLVSCIGRRLCQNIFSINSKAPIITKGTDEILSTFTATNKPIDHYIGNHV